MAGGQRESLQSDKLAYLDGEHVLEGIDDILGDHGWITLILCIQICPPFILCPDSPLGTLHSSSLSSTRQQNLLSIFIIHTRVCQIFVILLELLLFV